jgi:hypothetical protein
METHIGEHSIIIHGKTASRPSYSGSFRKVVFHPAYHTAYQAHFDSVRMIRRSGKDILNHSFRQFPGRLILFLYHPHPGTRLNIGPVFSIHEVFLPFLPLIRVGSWFHYGFSVSREKINPLSFPRGDFSYGAGVILFPLLPQLLPMEKS